jgi:hypothetical protein
MRQRSMGSAIGGLILLLLGLLFLAVQLSPDLARYVQLELTWPLVIVGVGLLFFVGVLFGGRSMAGLAVPGTIVTGIGLILYYQNSTGNWESWSYMWALIPGLVGLGIVLSGIFGADSLRQAISAGGGLILISLLLFAVFGFFLGSDQFTRLGAPLLLILVGVWFLGRNLLRGRG